MPADVRFVRKDPDGDGSDQDDREPNACEFAGCTFHKPDEMVARTTYGGETVHWYCPDHDPLDGDFPEHWEET